MNKITITTPENTAIEYRLAGLGSRTAAAIIDLIIQFIPLFLIGLGIFFTIFKDFNLEGFEKQGFQEQGWIIGGLIISLFIIKYGYFTFFEMKMSGRTPGKKIFNLRTIKNNGQPIDIKSSLIRNLLRIIIDDQGVGMLMIFFKKNHKRLGDLVASTIVVVEEKENIYTLEDLSVKKDTMLKEEEDILREYKLREEQLRNTDIAKIIKEHYK